MEFQSLTTVYDSVTNFFHKIHRTHIRNFFHICLLCCFSFLCQHEKSHIRVKMDGPAQSSNSRSPSPPTRRRSRSRFDRDIIQKIVGGLLGTLDNFWEMCFINFKRESFFLQYFILRPSLILMKFQLQHNF